MSTPDPQNQPPSSTPPPAQDGGFPAPPAPGPAGYAAPAAPAAPGYSAPGYPAAPQGYPATAPVPGRTLSIVGLILAFILPLVGMILSLVARSKLKKAGAPTGLATAGFWVGLILTIVEIIGFIVIVMLFSSLFSMCSDLGPGVWDVNGVTYTCG